MDRYGGELTKLAAEEGLRLLRDVSHAGKNIIADGRTMLNLSSNDYLGIGSGHTLWQQFISGYSQSGEFGGGSCSSRLLTGNHPGYTALENTISDMYGAESAMVFGSGYLANTGILPAVATQKDLILADKFVHASIIDGIRLSRARFVRYPHNDCGKLKELLEKERKNYENVFIVTESVFSMDGDVAALRELVEIKRRYGAYLYVDEAHAIGVHSPKGLGICDDLGIIREVDFLIGTFGKAIASQGAFVVTGTTFRQYLVNTMRPLIFSTALPPVSVRWTEFVMDRIGGMDDKRKHLKKISARLRKGISETGFETGGESNIVPIIVGSNVKAARLSEHLCNSGFFVLPIRTPTVPSGSERVRISLTAAVTEKETDNLIEVCKRFGT